MDISKLTEEQADFILSYQLAQQYGQQEFQQMQEALCIKHVYQYFEFQNCKQKARALGVPKLYQQAIKNNIVQSLFEQKFTVIRELGKGGFGSVIHVQDRSGPNEYAVKIVKTTDYLKVLHEIQVLSQLQSQFIVRYYDAWIEGANIESQEEVLEDSNNVTAQKVQFSTLIKNQYYYEYEVIEDEEDSYLLTNYFNNSIKDKTEGQSEIQLVENLVYIQMELCKGQTLQRQIELNSLSEKSKWTITTDLLLGLEFIHRKKIIHRDIKPENIFLSENLAAKYGDFGIAFNSNTKQQQNCGTIAYMPQESFKSSALTFSDQCKRDIYSLGLTFLLLWQPNFDFQLYRDIKGNKQSLLNKIQNYGIKKIIEMMTEENYQIRCSLEELLKQEIIFQNIENIDSFVISYCQNLKSLQQSGDNVQKLINLLVELTPLNLASNIQLQQVQLKQINYRGVANYQIMPWDQILVYQNAKQIQFLDQYLQGRYMIQNDQTLLINIQQLPILFYMTQNLSTPKIFYSQLNDLLQPILVQKFNSLQLILDQVHQIICCNFDKQIYICHLFTQYFNENKQFYDENTFNRKVKIKRMDEKLKNQFIWDGFQEFSFVFVINNQVKAYGGIIGNFIQIQFSVQ
ncbi:Kinase, PEK [Spironucleus salmonicida]|uniref:non-specific serine/threonine protein kinase n=1 Tax=Spironucleus salmonicida TaxID=348837 RepID=V6LWP5_9EUKA|nr:Kinase, PEK [Spironucleus salmonicida]|eukprot:EST45214.1 Kinase, PEK [Spironucleus salmonicida]